jgi:molybdopterin-guanine dinucleotide biosynthesis protein A
MPRKPMLTNPVPFAAALLAGGRSLRMGRDKAWLPWGGEPLWRHQWRTLAALAPSSLLLSCRTADDFPDLTGGRAVADAWPEAGPAGGLASCLANMKEPLLVALGVDMPAMPPGFLLDLLSKARVGQGIAVRQCDGAGRARWEPLAAVWPRGILPLMESSLRSGCGSLQKILDSAEADGLMMAWDEPVPTAWLANANTPSDWEELQRAAHGGTP